MVGQGAGCQGPWRPGLGHHTAGRKEGRAPGVQCSPPTLQPIVHLWARVQMMLVARAKHGTYRLSVNKRALPLFQDLPERAPLPGEDRSALAPQQCLSAAAPESSIRDSERTSHGAGTPASDRRVPYCMSLLLLLNGSEPRGPLCELGALSASPQWG